MKEAEMEIEKSEVEVYVRKVTGNKRVDQE